MDLSFCRLNWIPPARMRSRDCSFHTGRDFLCTVHGHNHDAADRAHYFALTAIISIFV